MEAAVVAALALVAGIAVTGCSGGGNDDAAEARRFFRGADCATLRQMLDQSDLAASLAGPGDPTRDLEQTARFLREARGRVPDGLAEPVRTLAPTYAALAAGARKVDWAAIGRGDALASIPAARLARRIADPRFGAAAFTVAGAAARACPA
jgi:hypothetical protein